MTDASQDGAASPARGEVTAMLGAWRHGEREAAERLFELVYLELRAIAGSYFRRERAGQTLQPTALVHEAYLRLVDQTRVEWKNRGHFFAVASQAMRRALVDHARSRAAAKRGGGLERQRCQAFSRAPAGRLVPEPAGRSHTLLGAWATWRHSLRV